MKSISIQWACVVGMFLSFVIVTFTRADELASGIYFYSLKLDAHEQTRKMLFLK